MTTSPRQSKPPETDADHFVLTFENNRYASELFGQFDQHLKLLEERLQIDARARGNSVVISGDVAATNQARRALDYLYGRLQNGAPQTGARHPRIRGMPAISSSLPGPHPRANASANSRVERGKLRVGPSLEKLAQGPAQMVPEL